MQRYAKTDEAISELNVILVYKKVVQGLIYSPPDCDKYLALDAKPQGLSSVGSDSLAPTVAHSAIRDWQRLDWQRLCARVRKRPMRFLDVRPAELCETSLSSNTGRPTGLRAPADD